MATDVRPLPTDNFDLWFTNRVKEIGAWRTLLNTPAGQPARSQHFRGVTGSGKTHLRRRFEQLSRTAGVPYVTVELDLNKGGAQSVDLTVLVFRLVSELGIEAPRTMLALLQIAAMESGNTVEQSSFAAELGAEAFAATFDAILDRFESLSLGGIAATVLKTGYDRAKKAKEPLNRYLKTEEGKRDRSWITTRSGSADIRDDLYSRLAFDLEQALPRPKYAVQAVLFLDSGEHGGETLPWVDDLVQECTPKGGHPRIVAAIFGQNPIESKLDLAQHNLSGFLRGDAEAYCRDKRNVPAVQVQGALDVAREDGSEERFHVYSLGLYCDAALDGKGDLARHKDDDEDPARALTNRFLRRLDPADQGFLRRLALVPTFDKEAACFACDTGPDEERREAKMGWLTGYSFVQPAGESEWRLHAVMRRVLAETSKPEDNQRRHREWLDHWSARSQAATDSAGARAWHHRFALRLSDAMGKWSEVTEAAMRRGDTATHAWLVDVARPLVAAPVLGGMASTAKARATSQHDWATESQVATIGDIRSRLEEAVKAFESALEVRTREAAPMQWAATQNNLGNALATLGGREEGTARLEEAVAAFRAALEVRTREAAPMDWAMTQNNLGSALQTLGGREEGTVRLEEAVKAFESALEVYTREAAPMQWAATQNNLGNALATLGGREEGTARLEEAVAAFRA
ncbi:MAG: hypothetical protein AB7T05_10450, partial [Fimbriimonadaceae bacterium]